MVLKSSTTMEEIMLGEKCYINGEENNDEKRIQDAREWCGEKSEALD